MAMGLTVYRNQNILGANRTFPFNSEVGSVGVGDYDSLKRFMPEENMVVPHYARKRKDVADSVWNYHKYIGYDTIT